MISSAFRRQAFWTAGAALAAVSPLAAQETVRVSVDSQGIEANGRSGDFSRSPMSDDGRFVAFESVADNLVASDTNLESDVFVRDLETGVTTRVSVSSTGIEGTEGSFQPAISHDGRFVAFISESGNLVPGTGMNGDKLFVHDRVTGQTRAINWTIHGTTSADCREPTFSGDGRYLAFACYGDDLVVGDTNGTWDVFLCELATGAIVRVSVGTGGIEANDVSLSPSISGDGSRIAFHSAATNLAASDTNGEADIFVHDRATGVTTRVSVDSQGGEADRGSGYPALARNGAVVAFTSMATNLVPGDTNAKLDVFVHELASGVTTRVSVSSTGVQSDGHCEYPWISADGRFVVFESDATNLISTNLAWYKDAFIRDRIAGTTYLASVPNGGGMPLDHSHRPVISPNGRFVTFNSVATNVVAGDNNGEQDVFRHDRGVDLSAVGACPGALNFEILGARPRDSVLLLVGLPGGTTTKPSPPCQGLTAWLISPRLLARVRSDEYGTAVAQWNAPAGACGRKVLAVDLASCTISNPIFL